MKRQSPRGGKVDYSFPGWKLVDIEKAKKKNYAVGENPKGRKGARRKVRGFRAISRYVWQLTGSLRTESWGQRFWLMIIFPRRI